METPNWLTKEHIEQQKRNLTLIPKLHDLQIELGNISKMYNIWDYKVISFYSMDTTSLLSMFLLDLEKNVNASMDIIINIVEIYRISKVVVKPIFKKIMEFTSLLNVVINFDLDTFYSEAGII